jgi:gp16 family phage-associated protein
LFLFVWFGSNTVEHKQPNAPAAETLLDGTSRVASSASVRLKSPTEAQKWFSDRGITISEWALARSYNPALVYQVLAGTRKAVRGTSFRIAVDLGLKAMPLDDVLDTTA